MMDEEHTTTPAEGKGNMDLAMNGIFSFLIFPFMLRFVRAMLVFLWAFVAVIFFVQVMNYSVSHGNPFHLASWQFDLFLNYFTFGEIAGKNGDVSGLVLRSLLQWVFIVGVTVGLIGGAYDKWKHRVPVVLPFRAAVISRMRFHVKIFVAFFSGTFLIVLITEGWNGAFAILFGYVLVICPSLMGAVFLVTVFEKGIAYVGERYFGIQNNH
jgi:hypothetical protein